MSATVTHLLAQHTASTCTAHGQDGWTLTATDDAPLDTLCTDCQRRAHAQQLLDMHAQWKTLGRPARGYASTRTTGLARLLAEDMEMPAWTVPGMVRVARQVA